MIVDLFLVYQFVRRLATPFEKWPAFEQGIIDKDGNILKKRKDFKTVKERDSWGKFDVMILKLKKLLEKVPGGKSRIASYAAALWLLKENKNVDLDTLTEEEINESLLPYLTYVEDNSNSTLDDLFENFVDEDMVANSAGSGAIAGIGIGNQGEPGLTKNQMSNYKKRNKKKIVRGVLNKT